jgi:hypothetical protein
MQSTTKQKKYKRKAVGYFKNLSIINQIFKLLGDLRCIRNQSWKALDQHDHMMTNISCRPE